MEHSPTLGTKLVPADKRPTHRLGWIPFVGKKVDSIEWAREEIKVCTELLEVARGVVNGDHSDQSEGTGNEAEGAKEANGEREEITEGRKTEEVAGQKTDAAKGTADVGEGEPEREQFADGGKGEEDAGEKIDGAKKGTVDVAKEYPPLNSAFVTFNRQIAAHMAVQVLAHHEPYRMSEFYALFTLLYCECALRIVVFFVGAMLIGMLYVGGKYVEVSPEDVIWGNLGLNPYEMKVYLCPFPSFALGRFGFGYGFDADTGYLVGPHVRGLCCDRWVNYIMGVPWCVSRSVLCMFSSFCSLRVI